MPNPNKTWGQTRVTVDGLYLQTAGKNTFEIGGIVRAAVTGDNKAGFFNETTKESTCEVEVLMTAGVSLVALQAIDNATLVHVCDTGQTYIMRNAFVVDAVSASDGKVKVKFAGPPAEEELA